MTDDNFIKKISNALNSLTPEGKQKLSERIDELQREREKELEVRELKHKLKDMNIPESRRNLFDDNNVRWLLRNLAIRNKNHPEFKNVISKLTALSKDKNPLIIK